MKYVRPEHPAYWITYIEDRQPLLEILDYVSSVRKENVKEFLDIYMPSTLRTLTDYSNAKINWMEGESQYKLLQEYLSGFSVSKDDGHMYDTDICEHISDFYTLAHLKTAMATRDIYKLIPLEDVIGCYDLATWYGTDAITERVVKEKNLPWLSDEDTQRNIRTACRFTNPTYGVPGDEEAMLSN